jgi:hypothetical protein
VKSDRPLIIFMAVVIGMLLGNLGWVLPSAIARGGGDNLAACVLLPVFSLLIFALLWVGPNWPE